MKEIFYSVFLMFVLGTSVGTILIGIGSCEQQQKVKQGPQQPIELSKDNENYYYKVVEYTYEGCEYIKVGYGKSIWGSHKGNCKNPIHKGQHPSPYIIDIPDQTLIVEDQQ
jgi:hypothetical protein